MLMVDWVTAKVPFFYAGILSDGEIISVTRDGQIEYSTPKRLSVRGSYDGSITLKTSEVDSDRNTIMVELSGNPVKFLQGHNLFGSDDLPNLILETVTRLSELLLAPQPDSVMNRLKSGDYTISRVDINTMLSLGSRAEVLACLYSMSMTTRTRSQAAITRGSTVYLNKQSRRWSFKFYSKGQEAGLRRNNKQGTIELPEALRDWVDPMLRAELTLKSNELRERGYHIASEWFGQELIGIFSEYIERIDMTAQALQTDITELYGKVRPRTAVSSYQLWKDGHDVRQLLSKAAFYKHRSALLEHGIDIALPPPPKEEPTVDVVPMFKTLNVSLAQIPHWVIGTDLYFEPRKLCGVA